MAEKNNDLNTLNKSITNIFSNTNAWFYTVLAIVLLSVLRGIRFPGMWSYTHFLFNYDYGFTKRALLGGIVNYLDIPFLASYEFFLIFSMALFITNLVLLCLLLKELTENGTPILVGSSLIFASSLAVVFLSHSIGYFDHIGLMITLITLKTRGFYKKLYFLTPSLILALLVHEAILVIFFPLIIMSLLFSIKPWTGKRKIAVLSLFSASVVVLGMFVTTASLESEDVHKMYTGLQTQSDHTLRKDAFHVLRIDSEKNYEIMQTLWSDKRVVIQMGESLLVTAPVILLLIYCSVLILRKSGNKPFLMILSILAPLSPLLLHIIAWDMHRWNTLTVTTGFLMLYIVYTSMNSDLPVKTPNYILPMIVFILFLNGASTIGLFDGYRVKQFPFIEHREYFLDIYSGKDAFPHVPKR